MIRVFFMQIIFYKCSEPSNTINKVLTNPVATIVKIRGEIDINNFSLRVMGDFTGQNYCYIPDLRRYYFIEKVERVGRLFEISLNCDLLETFKDDILGSVARFRRNIKNGDYMAINLEYSNLKTVDKFSSSVVLTNESHYILTTIAKGDGV